MFVAFQTPDSIFGDWLFNRCISGFVIFKPGYFEVLSSYSKLVMPDLFSKECVVVLGEVISHF